MEVEKFINEKITSFKDKNDLISQLNQLFCGRVSVSTFDEGKYTEYYILMLKQGINDPSSIENLCYGLIFNMKNKLVCWNHSVLQNIDQNLFKGINVWKEMYDGTSIRMFYDCGNWIISTNRYIDACVAKWGTKSSFGDMFKKYLKGSQTDTPEQKYTKFCAELNKEYNYFFVVQSRETCKYIKVNEPRIIHVETFDLLHHRLISIQSDEIKNLSEIISNEEIESNAIKTSPEKESTTQKENIADANKQIVNNKIKINEGVVDNQNISNDTKNTKSLVKEDKQTSIKEEIDTKNTKLLVKEDKQTSIKEEIDTKILVKKNTPKTNRSNKKKKPINNKSLNTKNGGTYKNKRKSKRTHIKLDQLIEAKITYEEIKNETEKIGIYKYVEPVNIYVYTKWDAFINKINSSSCFGLIGSILIGETCQIYSFKLINYEIYKKINFMPNNPNIEYNITRIICEKKEDEFIKYYPEYKEKIEILKKRFDSISEDIYKKYKEFYIGKKKITRASKKLIPIWMRPVLFHIHDRYYSGYGKVNLDFVKTCFYECGTPVIASVINIRM